MLTVESPYGVIFDKDGTVIDLREYVFGSFFDTLSFFGNKKTEEEIAAVMGLPLKECFRVLLGEDCDVDSYISVLLEVQNDKEYLIKPFPNTLYVLEQLRRKGIPLGIVTSMGRDKTDKSLRATGIKDYISTVVCEEDVVNPKPSAEGVLKAASEMGIVLPKSYFIGDSIYDIQAGNAAGIKTIAALYGLEQIKIQLSEADHFIYDIMEILDIIPQT